MLREMWIVEVQAMGYQMGTKALSGTGYWVIYMIYGFILLHLKKWSKVEFKDDRLIFWQRKRVWSILNFE